MDCSIPGFPVLQYLLEFAQTHVPWVGDAIQPSHPLSPTSLPALSLSQHQGLFQWVSSLHQVAKVLDLSRECVFLDSLSCHNKDLEWRTLKPPRRVTALRSWIDRVIALRSRKDRVIALRQISVTALFYLEDSRKIHLRGVRAPWSKDTTRRAPQRARERERVS